MHGTEVWRLTRQIGAGANSHQFHVAIDALRADVQRAADDVGEAQHLVDLIRIVAAAGRDHGVCTERPYLLRHHFRSRIRQRQNRGEALIDFTICGWGIPVLETPENPSAPIITSASLRMFLADSTLQSVM